MKNFVCGFIAALMLLTAEESGIIALGLLPVATASAPLPFKAESYQGIIEAPSGPDDFVHMQRTTVNQTVAFPRKIAPTQPRARQPHIFDINPQSSVAQKKLELQTA